MTSARDTLLSARFDDGMLYAIELHRQDRRKGSDVPYVAHLLGVCSIALENGANEDEAIAALLHDAAEDHGGHRQLALIRKAFGDEVATIVEECSDSLVDEGAKKDDWVERKSRYLAHLAEIVAHRRGNALVSAADKLYNLRSIDADLARAGVGEAVFARFKGGKWGTLWYYRSLADIFATSPGRHSAIAAELAALVDRLAGGRDAAALFALHQTTEARK
jgi:(p)ppGpp synthase/HD superfamily hydrolase